MPTTTNVQDFWQNHAGARWLIPMAAVMVFVVLGILAMVLYPHVG